MRIGSLFAGIGGLDWAAERALDGQTVWQIDLTGEAVRRRHWPDAEQIVADVRAVDPSSLPPIDVLVGGFPCQDLSCAGPGAGLDGARSGLYREVLRFAAVLRPQVVVVENVAGLLRYLDRLQEDWSALGYGLTWTTCRASDAGHPHRRRRVFVVAERGGGRGDVPTDCPEERQQRLWATPRASDARSPGPARPGTRQGSDGLAVQVRPWPTPCARDYRTGQLGGRHGGDTLSQAATEYPVGTWGSRLAPEWVEALMGLPVGWTLPDGPRLEIEESPLSVRGRYPEGWDRSQEWPGYAWEPRRTLPDGPPCPGRPARIRALGNAVCPQQGLLALRTLLGGGR